MTDPLDHRCGTCARFVRVTEKIDDSGEVKRVGECLLGSSPAPLFETSTCSQWVQKGMFAASLKNRPIRVPRVRRSPSGVARGEIEIEERAPLVIPEEILDMDAEEFRAVLREVIREEIGVSPIELGGRWQGGEMILKPGKEGTQEKRIPIESLFHKIVMVRDKLRVLEQKINAHPQLSDEEKVQMQQYVTGCYGSLTTFNVLFAEKSDSFTGQKGDE